MHKAQLFKYAFLALPLAFAGLPIYIHAPDYYTTNLGISLTAIGYILLILRAVDAVQDPIIGHMLDKFPNKRKHIITLGFALTFIGFFMVFHPPNEKVLLWFSISIFLCTTGFSILAITLQTLGGLWPVKPNQRTRITTWREGFGLVGVLLASITPPILLEIMESQESAFSGLTVIFFCLFTIGAFAFSRWFKLNLIKNGPQKSFLEKENFRLTPWHTRFYGLYLISNIASAVPAVLVLFFIRDRLEAEAYTGLFLMLYFLSGALGMPLWQKISKKLGKLNAWMLSMSIAISVFIWAVTLSSGDILAYAIICILSGLALGAELAIPPALLADYLNKQEDETRAAKSFALMTFISKLSLAIATGLTLPTLAYFGYNPSNITSYNVTFSLSLLYGLLPCLLKTATLVYAFVNRKKIMGLA